MTAGGDRDGLVPEGVVDFPVEEYEARIERLHRGMAEVGVDAILVADDRQIRYFTGHYTDLWQNKSRSPLAVLRADAPPTLIVQGIEEPWARQCSWVEDIRGYADLEAGPPESEIFGAPEIGFSGSLERIVLAAVKSAMPSSGGRLGIVKTSHMRFDGPLFLLDSIASALPGVEWVDVAPLLWQCRMVKSDREADYVVVGVKACDYAFEKVLEDFTLEMTEDDLARHFKAELLLGGSQTLGFVSVSDIASAVFGPPAERRYSRGAIVNFDAGACVRGYYSDQSRVACIGTPDAAQLAAYRGVLEALDVGVEKARPGVKAKDVANAMLEILERAGGRSAFGRVGHGTGLEQPEPPSLHPEDETVLEEGMVISIEPNADFPGVGWLVLEDMVRVRPGGGEVLSPVGTPREFPVFPNA